MTKMIPASTPIKMYVLLNCFECFGNCIGLALQSKGLAGWLAVWLSSWPDGWLAGRLSSWSGNGLEVLSGRAGPCPAGTAPRAHACLAAAWRPSKRDGFVRTGWLASWLAGLLAGCLPACLPPGSLREGSGTSVRVWCKNVAFHV